MPRAVRSAMASRVTEPIEPPYRVVVCRAADSHWRRAGPVTPPVTPAHAPSGHAAGTTAARVYSQKPAGRPGRSWKWSTGGPEAAGAGAGGGGASDRGLTGTAGDPGRTAHAMHVFTIHSIRCKRVEASLRFWCRTITYLRTIFDDRTQRKNRLTINLKTFDMSLIPAIRGNHRLIQSRNITFGKLGKAIPTEQ